MRKYNRRQNLRQKVDPKIKRNKLSSDYYEKYIKLSIDTLMKRHQKDKVLSDTLKEHISIITPNHRAYLNLDSKLRDIQLKINSLNVNQSLIREAVNEHKRHSQKGFFSKIFSSPPTTSEEEYQSVYAKNVIKIKSFKSDLQELEKSILDCPVRIEDKVYGVTELDKLNKSSITRLSNVTLRIDAQFKALYFLRSKEAVIVEREEKALLREKEAASKVDVYRAYAASYFDRTRKLGEAIRKKLLQQEQLLSGCPYCGNTMGDTPHADHIYPVSKGGLSTVKNMVLVCSQCNLRKSDVTLREFINRNGLNRDTVEQNLEILEKFF